MVGLCQESAICSRMFINIILQRIIAAKSVSDKYWFGSIKINVFWSCKHKVGAFFLLPRKLKCSLRKVLFWFVPTASTVGAERLVRSFFFLPFQEPFINRSGERTSLGMLYTLYFANKNLWNYSYYLAWDSQICPSQRIWAEVPES